eukprot:CAMPEP_0113666190 /NCGR_PEP_ID=MMETSP0038_2-20120614/2729_1 /TAXON_ID=2898 /ORGANISM="Cryptomonas paramecium" /LENGTH=71 /DNA_ID=CAMNT_0000581639 /DNA_START=434 /DNA_END=647 /DNA_ORIENTATION=+ /assembly_acc=CAM_ASM_000170
MLSPSDKVTIDLQSRALPRVVEFGMGLPLLPQPAGSPFGNAGGGANGEGGGDGDEDSRGGDGQVDSGGGGG